MRLLIVEDEVRLADTLRQLLNRQGYTADVCYDGVSGLDNAMTGIYDLMVLDVMLPGINGFQVTKKLREAGVATPVLMLTAKSDVGDRIHGLDCGADYYLTKPFGIMELISRVKALLRRTNAGLSEKVLTIGNVCLDEENHKVTTAGVSCELTYKEYELLKLLMMNAGIVTSREEILEKVWGTNFEGESRTLDMHIKTLRQKLGESGSMIKTVRNVGYIFDS